jgi:hypothetical protein
VRDLPDTLARIHTLLRPGGLFVSKPPCVGKMNLRHATRGADLRPYIVARKPG